MKTKLTTAMASAVLVSLLVAPDALAQGGQPVHGAATESASVIADAPIFVQPGAQVPLRVAAKGTLLKVLNEDGAWTQVEFQDPQWGRRVGWIETRLIRINQPDLRPMDLSVPETPADERPGSENGSVQISPPPATAGQRSGPIDATGTRAQVRKGFWFNAGMGFGSLGCQDCIGRENGLSGGLSLGGTLGDKWLLGVGTTGWAKELDGETFTVGTLDVRFRSTQHVNPASSSPAALESAASASKTKPSSAPGPSSVLAGTFALLGTSVLLRFITALP